MHRNDSNLTATARGMAREMLSKKILALFSLHGGYAKGSTETKRAFDQLETFSVIIGQLDQESIDKLVEARVAKEVEERLKKEVAAHLATFKDDLLKSLPRRGKSEEHDSDPDQSPTDISSDDMELPMERK
ncbi:unnamed protein product [Bemisia tabaci]|uniref:Uncharacterized protein n=1 Tax=Bemisia tabaci TaxID=7038 RepID=A0A9P0A9C0_BEMTA|nr:unnamed protein product [Bemisia tabaci]